MDRSRLPRRTRDGGTNSRSATPSPATEPEDFSLVLGGPLYQLFRRARLSDDVLTLVHRRIVACVAITWLPLLLLSLWEGRAWWGAVDVPFLLNVEVHARFLVALPLLIVAELVVHQRTRQLLAQFVTRDLISESDRPRLDAAMRSAMRLRNSLAAEIGLVIMVYGIGVPLRAYVAVDVSTWGYDAAAGSALGVSRLSLAGWWQVLVSLPLCQFLLVRWYFRLFIWTRFLWQVSRIDLKLVPTHPDRVGGLGFLANISYAFTPLLLAHGVLLSGMIADRIFFAGAALPQFMLEIAAPSACCWPCCCARCWSLRSQLARTQRTGLSEYGVLAQRYTREFEAKWIRSSQAPSEPLMGSADIQSLADLANSFEVIKTMRMAPFSKETILQLGVATLVPLIPLLLTMFSAEELMKRLLSMVF